MTSKTEFCLNDYDCIGFDLDNTLVLYDVFNMSKLIYDILLDYLVTEKSYCKSILKNSFQDNLPYMQRGLIFDFEHGNVVKLDSKGTVLIAYHGTNQLSILEVEDTYGVDKVWNNGKAFVENILSAWNGPLSVLVRSVISYFDVSCLLLWAQVIDWMDSQSNSNYPQLWKDLLDGLNFMYHIEGFRDNTGAYFPALKNHTELYVKRCPEKVVSWLRDLKQKNGKFLFLATGSAADFANFTASNALGTDWKELFDLILFFVKKPNFFLGDRPFVGVDEKELVETTPTQLNEDTRMISRGNWKDLMAFLSKKTGKSNPRVLYVGDNAVEDIQAPSLHGCCDTLAVVEELPCSNEPLLGVSKIWGSYFEGEPGKPSLWHEILNSHASLCVESVQTLADNPVEYCYNTDNSKFYPKDPLNASK